MLKLYSLLKQGRIRKKSGIYKRLWLMSVDVTIIFYVFVLVGYIVYAFVNSGDVFPTAQQFVLELEALSVDYFWVIMTVIPLGMLLRTFSQPGLLISTAEYSVTMLPYTKQQIWWMAAVERWVKLSIVLSVIGSGLWFFSPTSGPVILLYIGLLLVINMVMTVIEWRVFQLHFLWKMVILLGVLGVNVLSISTSPPIVASISSLTLIVSSIILLRHNVRAIDWKKVTAACDYKIWNMFLVSYMTKQKMKKERSYTLWQRLPFWRKDLPFRKSSLYHRLWHIYLQRQMTVLLQLMGALLVLVGFVPITNIWLVEFAELLGFSLTRFQPWLFLLAISIAVHVYASFVAVLWKDRLTTDIVQVVPWDVWLFHKTLYRWALSGSLIFLLPIGLLIAVEGSFLFLLQMMLFLCAFVLIVYWKVVDMIRTVAKEEVAMIPKHIVLLGYGLLLLMIVSSFFPYVLIIAFILLCFVWITHDRVSRR